MTSDDNTPGCQWVCDMRRYFVVAPEVGSHRIIFSGLCARHAAELRGDGEPPGASWSVRRRAPREYEACHERERGGGDCDQAAAYRISPTVERNGGPLVLCVEHTAVHRRVFADLYPRYTWQVTTVDAPAPIPAPNPSARNWFLDRDATVEG
jgi:hypothetical protein